MAWDSPESLVQLPNGLAGRPLPPTRPFGGRQRRGRGGTKGPFSPPEASAGVNDVAGEGGVGEGQAECQAAVAWDSPESLVQLPNGLAGRPLPPTRPFGGRQRRGRGGTKGEGRSTTHLPQRASWMWLGRLDGVGNRWIPGPAASTSPHPSHSVGGSRGEGGGLLGGTHEYTIASYTILEAC